MENRDRPVESDKVRPRQGLEGGTFPFDTASTRGREALPARIQSEFEGSNLVQELLMERRRQAEIEDAW